MLGMIGRIDRVSVAGGMAMTTVLPHQADAFQTTCCAPHAEDSALGAFLYAAVSLGNLRRSCRRLDARPPSRRLFSHRRPGAGLQRLGSSGIPCTARWKGAALTSLQGCCSPGKKLGVPSRAAWPASSFLPCGAVFCICLFLASAIRVGCVFLGFFPQMPGDEM